MSDEPDCDWCQSLGAVGGCDRCGKINPHSATNFPKPTAPAPQANAYDDNGRPITMGISNGAPQAKCETCGAPVRVVGETTLHYEPLASEVRAWVLSDDNCGGPLIASGPDTPDHEEVPVIERSAHMRLAAELEAAHALAKDYAEDWKRVQDAERRAEAAEARVADVIANRQVVEDRWTAAQAEVKRLREALDGAMSAIDKSIARADDYGDSHCSQPIREARAALGREG